MIRFDPQMNKGQISEASNNSNNLPSKKPEITFSIPGFRPDYAIYLDEKGTIQIVDSSQGSLIAKLDTYEKYFDQHWHVDSGKFYFIMRSRTYLKSKYLYKFDPQAKCIEHMLGPLKEPHFVKNRLVDFGTGCNEPDDHPSRQKNADGVITIYDLNQPIGERDVKKHILTNGEGGWNCKLSKKTETIIVWCDDGAGEREFPVFDEV